MEISVVEQSYPRSFHKKEASELGNYLKSRQSVVLIGMRRVGISNFLRFFLNHKDISETYIKDGKNHLFITVDLNDLVEREIAPFWVLTLKRIADFVEKSDLSKEVKKKIQNLFLESIQTQDLFFTVESIRKSLSLIVENGVLPTLFFIQFDRIRDALTHDFISNLVGLREGLHQKLSYVFTSFRDLHSIAPEVFTKHFLLLFSRDMFLSPVNKEDVRIIYQSFIKKYGLNISKEIERELFNLVDGYVRYLHLTLILFSEDRNLGRVKEGLLQRLLENESIRLQSEELWESLRKEEQEVILKVLEKGKLTKEDKKRGEYLFKTGMIKDGKLFSPLFEKFCRENEESDDIPSDFTKKEQALFDLLKGRVEEIVEREEIIEGVWPEEEALGVSDWAIDRLIARVRGKLKLQESPFEIQTIKTRGYKLVSR